MEGVSYQAIPSLQKGALGPSTFCSLGRSWQETEQVREINLRLSESPKCVEDVEMRRALLQLIRKHGTTLPTGRHGMLFSNLARHADQSLKLTKKRLRRLVPPTDLQLRLDLTAHKEAVFLI